MRSVPFGSYRRAIRIVVDHCVARAELEDDIHHLGVTLEHRDDVVVGISGHAWRTPWSVCPGALQQLEALRGVRLGDLTGLPAPKRAEHCLHLFDLVLLAANHAGQCGFQRHYRIACDFDRSPPLLTLWRDGAEALSWAVQGGRVRGSAFDAVDLRALPRRLRSCTEDEAEAALILRRASMIAPVRIIDLDAFDGAEALTPNAPASCYARQPARTADAARNHGSSRDFHGESGWPLE